MTRVSPSTISRFQLLLAVFVTLALVGTACSGGSDSGGAEEIDDLTATGRELVEDFVATLATSDIDLVDDLLAEGYQSQHGNGIGRSREGTLASLSEVRSWKLGPKVIATQHGDNLVVRWSLEVDSTIAGVEFGLDTRPRLTTFIWEDDRWRALSHANFNTPADQS